MDTRDIPGKCLHLAALIKAFYPSLTGSMCKQPLHCNVLPCIQMRSAYLQVNKIREVPQHPHIVVTHTDKPELYVWNLETQPNRASDQVSFSAQMLCTEKASL